MLKFETNLLKAIGLSDELQEEKQNPLFNNALVELGSTYLALNSTTSSGSNPLKSFLDEVWQAQDWEDIQTRIEEFASFLKDFENPEQVLRLGSNLFKAAKNLSDLAQVDFFSISPLLPRVEPLNRGALYELWNIFPGDTPRFMQHYYEGGGTPVDLADWGLLETYMNAPDVSRGAYKLQGRAMDEVNRQLPTATHVAGELETGVDATLVIFSMGNSTLKLEYTAIIDRSKPYPGMFTYPADFVSYPYTLELRYSVDDEFVDALDELDLIEGYQEFPGNPTSYRLTASWSQTYNGWTSPA